MHNIWHSCIHQNNLGWAQIIVPINQNIIVRKYRNRKIFDRYQYYDTAIAKWDGKKWWKIELGVANYSLSWIPEQWSYINESSMNIEDYHKIKDDIANKNIRILKLERDKIEAATREKELQEKINRLQKYLIQEENKSLRLENKLLNMKSHFNAMYPSFGVVYSTRISIPSETKKSVSHWGTYE
jgi:hypothetical protein